MQIIIPEIVINMSQVISTSNCMFLGQFRIIKTAQVSFQKHDESQGNFFMFLKTNEGYLSQIALKNVQLIVNYTLLLV